MCSTCIANEVIIFSDENNTFHVVDSNCVTLMTISFYDVNTSNVTTNGINNDITTNLSFTSKSYFTNEIYNSSFSQLTSRENFSAYETETILTNSIIYSVFLNAINSSQEFSNFELNIYDQTKEKLLGSSGQMKTNYPFKSPIISSDNQTFISYNGEKLWLISDFNNDTEFGLFIQTKCDQKNKSLFNFNNVNLLDLDNQYKITQVTDQNNNISLETIISITTNILHQFKISQSTTNSGIGNWIFFIIIILIMGFFLTIGCMKGKSYPDFPRKK